MGNLVFFEIALADDINEGIQLYETQKLTEAREFFLKYTSENPENEQGFYYLGRKWL